MKDFKAKCKYSSDEEFYKKGKIYEFKNGYTRREDGSLSAHYNSVNDFNICNSEYKFELVEDKPSFRVRCTYSHDKSFTTGKLYEVIDGVLSSDNCHFNGDWTKNVESINKICKPSVKFELIPEPKQFTKADLKTGMRVDISKEIRYIVLADLNIASNPKFGYRINLECYSDDLTEKDRAIDILDIDIVYDVPSVVNILNIDCVGPILYKCTKPRKITKSEAIKLLSEQLEEEIVIEG